MPVGKARLRYVVCRVSGTFAESSMEKGGWQPLSLFAFILALFHRQKKPGEEAFIIYSQIVFLYLSYFHF